VRPHLLLPLLPHVLLHGCMLGWCHKRPLWMACSPDVRCVPGVGGLAVLLLIGVCKAPQQAGNSSLERMHESFACSSCQCCFPPTTRTTLWCRTLSHCHWENHQQRQQSSKDTTGQHYSPRSAQQRPSPPPAGHKSKVKLGDDLDARGALLRVVPVYWDAPCMQTGC